MKLNKFIDHTLLKPTATPEDIRQLCQEALEYQFYSVCVNSSFVPFCKEFLKESDVKICSVVGFPLGGSSTKSKIFEAENAISEGASEIDMVLNLGCLKAGHTLKVLQEINQLKTAIGNHTLKVIIETCYLTDAEKKTACELTVKAGADFVKTSTGFGPGGATFSDVKLMLDALHGKAQVKASGGIRDFETAMQYINLGVSRIGTSNGIAIVTGFHHFNNKN